MEYIEANMELFDVRVRRLQNGHKLRVILECSENIELEKQLIEFRHDNVNLSLTQAIKPEDEKNIVIVEGVFEVFDVKCRLLRNGDKLCLILEKLYEKEKNEEVRLIKLRYDEVLIKMTKIQEDLFDSPADEVDDIEDPEKLR